MWVVVVGGGGGGVSFTRLNHDRTTHENLFTQFHRSHAYAPCTLEGRVPMWRTKKFPEKSLGGLIFKHMYDMFTRESESMHTPFSATFFTFTYAILLVHLHMQKRPDPFTHA